jgi:hypothetical protein
MAYINRLSDITNKLDINIENQVIGNDKLNNIDDNIETIRNLNNNTNTKLDTLHTDLDTTIHGDLTSTNTKLDTLHTDITSTNTKLDTLHTDLDTTIHGDLTSTNTKLDTLHTDLDGLTFDGSSNLNVNIASGSISISSVNIKDSAGNNLNSTSNALNSYITNASIPVTGTFYQATQPVSGTVLLGTTGNTVKLDTSNNSVKITDGTDTADIEAMNANFTSKKGLNTNSQLFGLNNTTGNNIPIHSRNLDGFNRILTEEMYTGTIDSKLFTTMNEYYKTGLNIYQIYPRKIHYTLSGRSESGAEGVIMGGTGSQKYIYDFTFGKATLQVFSAIQSGGSVPRTIKFHYVDYNGDLQTNGTATFTTLNTVVTLLPNMISINKFWIDGDVGASEQVLIRVGTGNTAVNTIASADYNDYYNGVITVPNGYIGYLSQFSLYTPGATWVCVVKWDENSIRSVVYNHFNGANAPVSSGFNGSIGGIFTAGESIAFQRGAVGASTICGNFVLEPI